jgi:hypothetical protein
MARAKKACFTLTGLLDTLSNYYWTNCLITRCVGQIIGQKGEGIGEEEKNLHP